MHIFDPMRGLIALGLLSASAYAAPGGTDDWTSLDADIAALAKSAPAAQPGGAHVSGLLRTFYAFADDDATLAGETLSGFFIDRAQVIVEGAVDDYSYRIQLEGAGGLNVLLDGYGAWQVNEYLRATLGRQRAPFLWESLLEDGDLLFLQRTDTGELFYTRQTGVRLDGQVAFFRWAIAIQNGFDGVAEESAYSARLAFDILGDGTGMKQGAYGGDDEAHLSMAIATFNDTSVPNDGDTYAADAQFELGNFAADAQVIDFPDDGLPNSTSIFPFRENSNPFAITASWLFIPDKYEFAVRYQDTDNDDQDTAWTFGVNRYIAGHDVKWLLNVVDIDSDSSAKDNQFRIGFGLNVKI